MHYGTTPWDEIFLNALQRHYNADTRRLDKGKSYANTGKIKSLKIDGGLIEARVQGGEVCTKYRFNFRISQRPQKHK